MQSISVLCTPGSIINGGLHVRKIVTSDVEHQADDYQIAMCIIRLAMKDSRFFDYKLPIAF